ncbi:cytochrome P450 [Cyathus striatus]|nr:cytochrome P450 [Cyathus striatus]
MTSFLNHPVVAVLLAYLVYYLIKWYRLRKVMPPGPLAVKPWTKFAEWNEQYGPVVSIFLGSTPVIILGTAQPAWDLLEKRSDIYSSRPRFVVAGEILSDNMRGLLLPNNNDTWRKWRKVLHSGFHLRKADTYREIQSLESKIMLHQFLTDPKNYERHIQRFAASLAVSVTYGRRVNSVDEWIVKENMESVECNIPGKYLVESWPWLLKLPRALQWFRREPETRKQRDINYLMYLLNDVKARMKDGTIPDCLAAQTISNIEQLGMDELSVAYAVSSPFGAGIETTSATMTTFILAMLHHPDVMRKAQAELDSVVGSERMPDFEDKGSLPYVRALINETLRWRPVAVLGGTPHAVMADDAYDGIFIPKEMFPSPETFQPERFLETHNPRLQDFQLPFGFGRRICPGMHLALNSLFINTARILWAFELLPHIDKNGKESIPDSWNYTDGFNAKPVSFECRIVPRNLKVLACIESEFNVAKERLENWQ